MRAMIGVVVMAWAAPAAAKDTTPPAWRKGATLTVTADAALRDSLERTLTFGWPPAIDDVGVTAYRLYRGDTLMATVPGDTRRHTLTTEVPAGAWRVEAGDAAGNWTRNGPSAQRRSDTLLKRLAAKGDDGQAIDVLTADNTAALEAAFAGADAAVKADPKDGAAAAGDARPNMVVRVGVRGRPGVVFRESLRFEGGQRALPFRHQGRAYRLTFEAEAKPSPSDGAVKRQWTLSLWRGKARLTRLFATHPEDSGSLGACDRATDYAATDGLWVEWSIAGSKYGASQACRALMPAPPE